VPPNGAHSPGELYFNHHPFASPLQPLFGAAGLQPRPGDPGSSGESRDAADSDKEGPAGTSGLAVEGSSAAAAVHGRAKLPPTRYSSFESRRESSPTGPKKRHYEESVDLREGE